MTIALKSAGKGIMHVHVNGRHVGNVEKLRGEDAWKAVPLREVAYAYPAGVGKARTAREAAKLLV